MSRGRGGKDLNNQQPTDSAEASVTTRAFGSLSMLQTGNGGDQLQKARSDALKIAGKPPAQDVTAAARGTTVVDANEAAVTANAFPPLPTGEGSGTDGDVTAGAFCELPGNHPASPAPGTIAVGGGNRQSALSAEALAQIKEKHQHGYPPAPDQSGGVGGDGNGTAGDVDAGAFGELPAPASAPTITARGGSGTAGNVDAGAFGELPAPAPAPAPVSTVTAHSGGVVGGTTIVNADEDAVSASQFTQLPTRVGTGGDNGTTGDDEGTDRSREGEVKAPENTRSSSAWVAWIIIRDYLIPLAAVLVTVNVVILNANTLQAWAAYFVDKLNLNATESDELTQYLRNASAIFTGMADDSAAVMAQDVVADDAYNVPVYLGGSFGAANTPTQAMTYNKDVLDNVDMYEVLAPGFGDPNATVCLTALFDEDDNGTQYLLAQWGAASSLAMQFAPSELLGPLGKVGASEGTLVSTIKANNTFGYGLANITAGTLTAINVSRSAYNFVAAEGGSYSFTLNKPAFEAQGLPKGYGLNTTMHLDIEGESVPFKVVDGNVTWMITTSGTGVTYPKLCVVDAKGNCVYVNIDWKDVIPVRKYINNWLNSVAANEGAFKAGFASLGITGALALIVGGRLLSQARGIRKCLSKCSIKEGRAILLAALSIIEVVTVAANIGMSIAGTPPLDTNLTGSTLLKYGPDFDVNMTLDYLRKHYLSTFGERPGDIGILITMLLVPTDITLMMVNVLRNPQLRKQLGCASASSLLNTLLIVSATTTATYQLLMGHPEGGFFLATSVVAALRRMLMGAWVDPEAVSICKTGCGRRRVVVDRFTSRDPLRDPLLGSDGQAHRTDAADRSGHTVVDLGSGNDDAQDVIVTGDGERFPEASMGEGEGTERTLPPSAQRTMQKRGNKAKAARGRRVTQQAGRTDEESTAGNQQRLGGGQPPASDGADARELTDVATGPEGGQPPQSVVATV